MCQAVRLAGAFVGYQAENRALAEEVHRGGILVQICKDWSERLAGVQFL